MSNHCQTFFRTSQNNMLPDLHYEIVHILIYKCFKLQLEWISYFLMMTGQVFWQFITCMYVTLDF
jgi:hypothetical protein